ncbi:hypothetical protein QJS10_CPA06g01140 [Acorus calamus]|uniref:Reverse transcriptase domain-containing protein n=1 Tax=Acorus calamus TaxID=4465 RepID=A0AAV9EJK5_ACOCL|nr:hypothetical protein QJS10_CPA06g01140 [Acorus calamus]
MEGFGFGFPLKDLEDMMKPAQLTLLEEPFSEVEIRKALAGVEGDKAPGPDGFGMGFYLHYWSIVKEDIVSLFKEFYEGNQSVGCLNASLFVLILKVEGPVAVAVDDFCPICLANGAYMLVIKVLANRLKLVCHDLTVSAQTAFLPGRYLQERFLMAQEVVSALHKDKRKGVVCKLDFAKAYDSVDRDFLQQRMKRLGFMPRWIRMGNQCISFFPLGKGLRQGDPFSPILFILVADVLQRLCAKVERAGWIRLLLSVLKKLEA